MGFPVLIQIIEEGKMSSQLFASQKAEKNNQPTLRAGPAS
jgi:hypothetical protein